LIVTLNCRHLSFAIAGRRNEAEAENQSFLPPVLPTSLDDFMQREDIAEDVKALYLLALEGTKSQEVFQSRAYHERSRSYTRII
jgi:hypothetical protein